jgi:hypothetical protein
MEGRFDPLANYGVTATPSSGRAITYLFLMLKKVK